VSSPDRLDLGDPDAVRRFFVDLRAAIDDADAVTRDTLRPLRRRELGLRQPVRRRRQPRGDPRNRAIAPRRRPRSGEEGPVPMSRAPFRWPGRRPGNGAPCPVEQGRPSVERGPAQEKAAPLPLNAAALRKKEPLFR
jgi:hypothetical protein